MKWLDQSNTKGTLISRTQQQNFKRGPYGRFDIESRACRKISATTDNTTGSKSNRKHYGQLRNTTQKPEADLAIFSGTVLQLTWCKATRSDMHINKHHVQFSQLRVIFN